MVIRINFSTASGLVGSGPFVTKRISARRGTCHERFIPNSGTYSNIDLSLIYVLEVWSLFQMDEPSEILSQYPSLRLLFPRDSFLRSLTRIRCYSHCFRNQTPPLSSLTSIT